MKDDQVHGRNKLMMALLLSALSGACSSDQGSQSEGLNCSKKVCPQAEETFGTGQLTSPGSGYNSVKNDFMVSVDEKGGSDQEAQRVFTENLKVEEDSEVSGADSRETTFTPGVISNGSVAFYDTVAPQDESLSAKSDQDVSEARYSESKEIHEVSAKDTEMTKGTDAAYNEASVLEVPVYSIPVFNSEESEITATFEPEDVSLSLNQTCGPCHSWVGNLDELRVYARASLSRINKNYNEPGLMPPPPSYWKNSPEGLKVIEFLEGLE